MDLTKTRIIILLGKIQKNDESIARNPNLQKMI